MPTYIILYYRWAMIFVALISVSGFIMWEIITWYPNRIVSAYHFIQHWYIINYRSMVSWVWVKTRNPRTLLYQIAGKPPKPGIILVNVINHSRCWWFIAPTISTKLYQNYWDLIHPHIGPAPLAPRRYQSLRWHQRSRHLEMLEPLWKTCNNGRSQTMIKW